MPFDVISRLRNATVEDRIALLEFLYEKNRQFFKTHHPTVDQLLEKTKCPYEIDLTSKFLNIRHTDEAVSEQQDVGLDIFAELHGDWVHNAWQEIFNFKLVHSRVNPLHQAPLTDFLAWMDSKFPEQQLAYLSGKLNLKVLSETSRYSPPVIFLGIFHGLQIATYLNRTTLNHILLIEPEVERFEVSLYFLDYEAIQNRFGVLNLALGDQVTSHYFLRFFDAKLVSTHMWVRVLPGYASQRMESLLNEIRAYVQSKTEVFFPLDKDISGFRNAYNNLTNNIPLLTSKPLLSKECKIAIVASGPSLDKDLGWLKKNRQKLVIFSVHSAVRALRKQKIKPDFQFSVETTQPDKIVKSLRLYRDVPLIAFYKTDSAFVESVNEIYLYGDKSNANLVKLKHPLPLTQPSTANLALSFALWCKPKQIYLLGCDFGYRDANRHHASNTYHRPGQLEQPESHPIVAPNFPRSGPVRTTPFLAQTRMIFEKNLASYASNITVVNLSDGAFIKGTISQKSNDIKLTNYQNKKVDSSSIRQSFQPASNETNYTLYDEMGIDIVKSFLPEIIAGLAIETFSWQDAVKAMDTCIAKAYEQCGQGGGGILG